MALVHIATTTLASRNTDTITFSNIPQTGKDLICKFALRGSNTEVFITLNSTYSVLGRMVRSINGTITSITINGDRAGWVAQDSYTSNVYGSGEVYIPSYALNRNKVISVDTVAPSNTSSAGLSAAGQRFDSSAVTSLTLFNGGGQLFEAGSSASLYIIS